MKQIFKFFFSISIFFSIPAWADLYTVENIEISGTGSTSVEAKERAITAGELKAFTQVFHNVVGNKSDVARPSDDDILNMVRDISISGEKSTHTSYRGKMNVRFNEQVLQDYLTSKRQNFLKKAPPTYLVVPLWIQGADKWALEDENKLYQTLKDQESLSNFFKIILPTGDLDEMVKVNEAVSSNNLSSLSDLKKQANADKILLVGVTLSSDDSWVISPMNMRGAENRFSDISVYGNGTDNLWNGWQRLMNQMQEKWQNQNIHSRSTQNLYYARFNLEKMSELGKWETELKKLKFLNNLSIQGAKAGQILFSFSYEKDPMDLTDQFYAAGWDWTLDSSDKIGTLKRKESHENAL